MIWIPIVIATLALMRCIVLEKRWRRLEARIFRLRLHVDERLRELG